MRNNYVETVLPEIKNLKLQTPMQPVVEKQGQDLDYAMIAPSPNIVNMNAPMFETQRSISIEKAKQQPMSSCDYAIVEASSTAGKA
jgi:hypothetical protein